MCPYASWHFFTFLLCKRKEGAESLELLSTIAHWSLPWLIRGEFDNKVLSSFFIVRKDTSLFIDRKNSQLKIPASIDYRRQQEYLRIICDSNTRYRQVLVRLIKDQILELNFNKKRTALDMHHLDFIRNFIVSGDCYINSDVSAESQNSIVELVRTVD